ncbi:MAG: PEP-CTERM sorting domain-containing protein [Kiritimatiellae bacterium]|nr:PEP-CTERM sorting domain-containing protein [Kiritimatiellia bacterium]
MQIRHTKLAWLALAVWSTQIIVWADIIYFRPDEPIHMQTLTSKTVDFDLDFNGVVDFVLRSDGATFDTVPQDQNSILSISATPPNMGADILQLQAGYEIGSSPTSPAEWVDPSTTPTFSSCMVQGCIGLWVGPERHGYFGVQFDIAGATHYGWVYLDNTFAGLGGGDITEWAYESTPDTGIVAGVIPEPTTLVLLMVSIACSLFYRRQHSRPQGAPRHASTASSP